MASVKLYNTQGLTVENKRSASSLGSFLFSLATIVLVLGIYGGLYFWGVRVDAQVAEVDQNVTEIKRQLSTTSEESDRVHDTFLRVEALRKMSNPDVVGFLNDLEKNIVVGAVVSKYEYALAENTITVEGDVIDFNTLLQMVRKLRSSTYFSSVVLESTGFSEKGYVLFSLKMAIAPSTISKNK